MSKKQKMMEYRCVRDEEKMDESSEEEKEEDDIYGLKHTDCTINCRGIRIGSYKILPPSHIPFLTVNVSLEAFQFRVPTLCNSAVYETITIRNSDITKVFVHFGHQIPIMFVFTTERFGETVRTALDMNSIDGCYFDPISQNEKIQKITFIIEFMSDEQRNFIRNRFSGSEKVHEIDEKAANKMLVRSTPNCISSGNFTFPQSSMPAVILLTYPPPPRLGGITITTKDLYCLDEKKLLNDAIIDFYLQYMFNKTLTLNQREKTHMFNTFFYLRLLDNAKITEDGETIEKLHIRRHNQVKTWSRYVDIFSKDFIIIPLNQNSHWILAIVCYPSKVPEVSNDNKGDSLQDIELFEDLPDAFEDTSHAPENISHSTANTSHTPENTSKSPENTTNQTEHMPCICIFDSKTGNHSRIFEAIRGYLEIEWKVKKGTEKYFDESVMQGFVMKSPQQTNDFDGGIYLLQAVESFYKNPIPHFGNPMPDLTNWFSESEISRKRQSLKELILTLRRI